METKIEWYRRFTDNYLQITKRTHISTELAKRYALFDVNWEYEHGILWGVRFEILRFSVNLWFQGDDLPF